MTLRALISIFALLALTSLTACGFRPLYAEDKDGQSTASDMARVKISMMEDRVGQLTRNVLVETLTPRGQIKHPEYVLTVDLSESTSELGFTKDNEATIADYILSAKYRLVSISDTKVLRSGTLRARTTFNLVDSDFASLEAETAAKSDAARNLARQIANQVAVGLRNAQ
ncbi:LPS assembly lipoprotein LptE [Thalassospira alkalitolerans]|uniref:LPS assembly lipoprotein LptE n=1 Tax=Thalassospira alkalitolerans TaxID=1293890 RepID=UPI003AA94011